MAGKSRPVSDRKWDFQGAEADITIPDNILSIGEGAFLECTNLRSINIPNSVTSIGMSAFDNCTNLTSINIPNSIISIGSGAFRYCTSLTDISIPNSVTSIGSGSFFYCTSLTNIIISGKVSSIEGVMFQHCKSLRSITISGNATSIGQSAFFDCANLKDVYYTGTESQWNAISIETNNECLTSATIHYNSPVIVISTVIANMNENNLNVSVSACGNFAGSNYTLFVAAYQEDGRMLGVRMVPVSFEEAGKETVFTTELKDCSSATRVKAMFVDAAFSPQGTPMESVLH